MPLSPVKVKEEGSRAKGLSRSPKREHKDSRDSYSRRSRSRSRGREYKRSSRSRSRSRGRDRYKRRADDAPDDQASLKRNRWGDKGEDGVKPEVKSAPRRIGDEPVVGEIYDGRVSKVQDFGCFVELLGFRAKKEGTALISSCLSSFFVTLFFS